MSKYTFLLPAYKSEYFDEAIRSILCQTYTDFTLMISDDCSPYDLKSIVKRYVDERLIYRRNECNIGGLNLVKHWNVLVNQCDSQYLIIASDDDIYCSNFLEVIDKMIDAYPTANLYRGRTETIDSEGYVITEDDYFAPLETQISFMRNIYGEHHSRCIGNYVFRTDVLKHNNGFIDFPYAWYSDTATTIFMACNGVANSTESIFKYRASEMSITGDNDVKTNKMKLVATLAYDKWLSNYIMSHVSAKSIVDKINLSITIKLYKKDIYGKFIRYMKGFSLCKRMKFYKEMSLLPLFDKKEFVKVYCLAKFIK